MDHFIADLFGPIILVVILLTGFAIMSGTRPESLIKPFFGFLGIVVTSLFNLFALGIKLVTQGGTRDYMRPKPLTFPNHEKPKDDDDDPPAVKVRITKD
jgi:hypothetical protein